MDLHVGTDEEGLLCNDDDCDEIKVRGGELWVGKSCPLKCLLFHATKKKKITPFSTLVAKTCLKLSP